MGNVPPDPNGLVGRYAPGNEPSHHLAYLHRYAGQFWKTQEKVSQICPSLYHDAPDGLSGTEDCGQLWAWYRFSALGFYPVNSADGIYVLGTLLFDEATPQVRNPASGPAKIFLVRGQNRSKAAAFRPPQRPALRRHLPAPRRLGARQHPGAGASAQEAVGCRARHVAAFHKFGPPLTSA